MTGVGDDGFPIFWGAPYAFIGTQEFETGPLRLVLFVLLAVHVLSTHPRVLYPGGHYLTGFV